MCKCQAQPTNKPTEKGVIMKLFTINLLAGEDGVEIMSLQEHMLERSTSSLYIQTDGSSLKVEKVMKFAKVETASEL